MEQKEEKKDKKIENNNQQIEQQEEKEINLEEKVKQLEQEKEELINHLKRLQAEFDNFRKRISKERSEWEDLYLSNFIKKLLPVLSDFERAAQHEPVTEAEKGFLMIYNKLKEILSKEGLEEIKALGEEFNPEFHDAIQIFETDPENDGKVIQEYDKGYKFRNIIIQHSKVIVGKAKESKDEENKNESKASEEAKEINSHKEKSSKKKHKKNGDGEKGSKVDERA